LKTKKEEIEKKKERNQEEKKKKFLAFETELLLRPNLGASRDASDAPSNTSMVTISWLEIRKTFVWRFGPLM